MFSKVQIHSASVQRRVGVAVVDFKPGINIIAGPNGAGKTTLLELIRDTAATPNSRIATLYGDLTVPALFHSSQQASASAGANRTNSGSVTLGTNYKSHGEALQDYLRSLSTIEDRAVVILDEPEMALSVPAIEELCIMIAGKKDIQFFISTHHPLIWTMKNANIITLGGDKNYTKKYMRKYLKRIEAFLER